MTTARQRRKQKRMEARRNAPPVRVLRCPTCGKPAIKQYGDGTWICSKGHPFRQEDAA